MSREAALEGNYMVAPPTIQTSSAARPAPVFAALGDPTRLRLVDRLRREGPSSTSALRSGTPITRQAVTKHLEVLAEAGLVRDERRGRERVWALEAAPLREVAEWVEQYRALWEERLDRLEAFLARTKPTEDKTS